MSLFACRFKRDFGVAACRHACFGIAASKDDHQQREGCQPPVLHISLPIFTFYGAIHRCKSAARFLKTHLITKVWAGRCGGVDLDHRLSWEQRRSTPNFP
ncbi:hypothetical protein [Paraburkholderia aromaticivorans]|uniref:hypothetical protein n=1 Tax=Paraburkholderia aromaticivorans TaxID=2026199 RepID=UPI001FC9EDFE|nr:hypothetical protein [Paraburkholderia aromaticivorans]